MTSSANVAIASKPRYDSTATDTAPTTADSANAPWVPSPDSGDSQSRSAPSCARTTIAVATKTSSTTISMASTRKPTRAAVRTPHRFSSVVTTTAIAVHTHRDTSGTRASIAIPENRYATAGMRM